MRERESRLNMFSLTGGENRPVTHLYSLAHVCMSTGYDGGLVGNNAELSQRSLYRSNLCSDTFVTHTQRYINK